MKITCLADLRPKEINITPYIIEVNHSHLEAKGQFAKGASGDGYKFDVVARVWRHPSKSALIPPRFGGE